MRFRPIKLGIKNLQMTFYCCKKSKHKERKVRSRHSVSHHCSYQLAARWPWYPHSTTTDRQTDSQPPTRYFFFQDFFSFDWCLYLGIIVHLWTSPLTPKCFCIFRNFSSPGEEQLRWGTTQGHRVVLRSFTSFDPGTLGKPGEPWENLTGPRKIWKTLKTETESWWEHLGHSLVRTGCDTNLNAQSSTLRSVGIEMYLYYQVICEPNKMIMKNNKKKNISYWNQNGQKHAAEQVNLNHIQFYSNSRPLNI